MQKLLYFFRADLLPFNYELFYVLIYCTQLFKCSHVKKKTLLKNFMSNSVLKECGSLSVKIAEISIENNN